MKTTFTTLFLLIMLFVAKSQTETYKPIFNANIAFNENTPVMNEGLMFIANDYILRDTIIDNFKYFFISKNGNFYNYAESNYIREDSIERKIWCYNSLLNQEKIIYDFSMQIGDSIFLEIKQKYNYSFPYYPASSFYQLDSIAPYLLYNGDTTRKFYLHCMNQPELAPLVWIEGVGSVNNLFYTIIGIDANPLPQSFSFCKECEGACYNYLRNILCLKKNDEIFFKNDCYDFNCMDTCQANQSNLVFYSTFNECFLYKQITVNITENELCLKNIKLLSNYIELDEMCNYKKMEIYNYFGQLVYKKNVINQTTIDFPDYLKGFYIVKLTDNNNNQVALKVVLN